VIWKGLTTVCNGARTTVRIKPVLAARVRTGGITMRHMSELLLILMCLILLLAEKAFPQIKTMPHSRGISNAELPRKMNIFIDRLAAEDRFSGVVLISKSNRVVFKKAVGLASKRYKTPNRVDTKFNLGSMSKMFTGVAIAQLAERGNLSFDDTVGKHMPDYPNKKVADMVTIHHLLTHTSGMGDYLNEKFDQTSRAKFREIRDFLPLFVDEPLRFEPGTSWDYSNSGYMLLGAIIEKVSGQNYFEYIREKVFKPAGMVNSDSYELDRETPNLATGYTREMTGPCEGGEWRNNSFIHVIRGGPAGGGYSTAEDLFRFTVALKGNKLLGPKYTELILSGKVEVPESGGTKSAYGFREERVEEYRRVGHDGGFPGISSELAMYPDLGYTVIVMSNYDPPASRRVSNRAAKLLMGIPTSDAVTVPRPLLRKYEGSYKRENNVEWPDVVDIKLERDGLWLIADGERHKLVPLSETEFFDQDFEEVRLTFTWDNKAEAVSLKLENAAPETVIARKIELPPPSLKGSTTFKLEKCLGAKTVELVGSFNDWKRAQLLFGREGHQWVIRVDLPPGRYTYRFVVNGQSTTDPFNPVTEVDEKGIARSVLIVEALHRKS
jgi:D-alanyl-D-alanine carboxypeptidase